jgi:hypothetical protein
MRTLVVSLPPLERARPPLAGAIITAVCEKQGHEVKAVDLQLELDHWLGEHGYQNSMFDSVFYDYTAEFNLDQKHTLNAFIDQVVNNFHEFEPNYIILSYFSFLAQKFSELFLPVLRKKLLGKIIIGGPGISSVFYQTSELRYGEIAKQRGLVDYYVTGEAEQSLPRLFAGEAYPGINNRDFVQISDLDSQPWPNYSAYDLARYQAHNNKPELVIIGSRGCVRSCSFCDVVRSSPKYRYRSGANIAAEMIHHYEQHGVRDFYFADSLINGSYRAFDDMCKALIKYPVRFNWRGQYIIRSKTSTPKHHFDLLAEAGGRELMVGIETGSDQVRFDLGKKFTNDDIEYYLENFHAKNISCLFLFFTGYVTETLEDHKETLRMFPRWQKYVATGTIRGVETFNIMNIFPGSPLELIARQQGYEFAQNPDGSVNNRFWINPGNSSLDFEERVRRHAEMMRTAIDHKWPLWNGLASIEMFADSLREYRSLPKSRWIKLNIC